MHSAYRVAGLPVLDLSVQDAIECLRADAAQRRPRVYAFVNAYSATLRRGHPEYLGALESSETYPLADGSSLVFGAKLMKNETIRRCPGPDFFDAFCDTAAKDRTAIFLLGGGPGVAETLRDRLVASHPGLQVAGVATPPYGEWTERQSADLIAQVSATDASVVWLGVSAPKQEMWATRYACELGVPVVCVGAAFDFLAGTKRRAPHWVRRIGMEWLHRLLTEPRRLWKRYLAGNAVFLWDLVRLGVHSESAK